MDRMGSDFLAAVNTMKEKLGANAHPLLAMELKKTLKVCDLVKMIAYIYDESDESGVKFDTVDIPDDYIDQANSIVNHLLKQFLILMTTLQLSISRARSFLLMR